MGETSGSAAGVDGVRSGDIGPGRLSFANVRNWPGSGRPLRKFCTTSCYHRSVPDPVPQPRRGAPFRLVRQTVVRTLALIGLFWLAAGPVVRLLAVPLFHTEVVRASHSPDRAAVAEVEVRRGGLGTVWTTRVHLRYVGRDYWTVYKAKNSDFVPPLRWTDRDTLLIGLPCGRFDHLSNPDDGERSDPTERRLKVRFAYPGKCEEAVPR